MFLQTVFNSAEYQQYIANRDARDARESNERALGIIQKFSPQQLDRIERLLREDDRYRLSYGYKIKKFVVDTYRAAQRNPIKVTIVIFIILLAMVIFTLIRVNIAAIPLSLPFKIGLAIAPLAILASRLLSITEGRHGRNESFAEAFRNQWIKEFGRN